MRHPFEHVTRSLCRGSGKRATASAERWRRRALFVAVAAMSAAGAPCLADGVAGFYKGRTIEVYVAGGAGGGYDLYARVLSEFMTAHIPGSPAMVPRIMSGSGGVKAANYVYNVAPKDGSAIALLLSSQPTTEAIGRAGVKYKSANLSWIGRIVDIVSAVTVKRHGPATTVEELKKTELVAGATGPGSTTHMPFAMMNWALGTRFRIVNGYKGSAGPALAFDRGEVQAASAPWDTIVTRRPHLLKEIQLVQVALEKNRAHPNVPLLLDLVTDPEKKAAVTFLSAQASIGRTVSAPPRVPEERVVALRKAFDATMKDRKFIAAVKQRRMDLAPLNGEQVEKLVLEHLSTPGGIVRIAKEAAGMK